MDRLGAIELRDDRHFFDYGLSEADVQDPQIWAAAWADGIRQRSVGEDITPGASGDGPDWDRYLAE
ncbi:hypothetical protein BJ973_000793 [Actinoplanes tereljensis]|uniref:Uncharacterized protein n=1 Tax=Paractinoplanes tereljensis TaxID=571912 RepID=A0A919TV15_9ACTN|nr:hypothetical protein [Actinoplanes tereljensis]GIF22849.1 hypothetical protein Ate02nite_55790 [Actinoplanes tereljensis]